MEGDIMTVITLILNEEVSFDNFNYLELFLASH